MSTRRPKAARRFAAAFAGLQRQMRRRRVKADVSRAAVVLTNPTHYAVALGFDFATMEAPQGAGQGTQPAGRGDQGRGALGGRADRREPAAGAFALSLGRGRPVDSRRISMPRWPRFLPISTASAWRPSCASAAREMQSAAQRSRAVGPQARPIRARARSASMTATAASPLRGGAQ